MFSAEFWCVLPQEPSNWAPISVHLTETEALMATTPEANRVVRYLGVHAEGSAHRSIATALELASAVRNIVEELP